MSVHWWMAGFYLLLFIGGAFMAQLSREVSFRGSLYDVHKSIGLLTIALLLWRIVVLLQVWWKKYTRHLPRLSPKWWRNMLLHALLYGFMVVVPLAGLLLSNSFKAGNVAFFGLVITDLFPENKAMVDVGRSLHFWLSYTFLAFIVLHTIAQWRVAQANLRRLGDTIKRLRPSDVAPS
ncbi:MULTISPECIES: cytochrome b [unclassified Cyanobium]|uniref:cytochrome b n=1 Tax=unclassified Cyanobium TaxID=2627006 RepID=UPI0020CCD517|nr:MULTISPECIES: cytochrome b/b6 domain-containing protein [unclassified Cyanobium]